MYELHLVPGELTLEQLRQVHLSPVRISLDPACHAGIERSAETVSKVIE